MAVTILVTDPSESPTASASAGHTGHSARMRLLAGPALILLAAAIAAMPMALHRPLCADDLQFHLVSWIDVQQSWQHGIPYPHWAPSANFGAGEPRFLFYPPLTWMLGAALGLVFPWNLVPAVLTFVLLAATGLSTRTLAREALPEASATLAGCIALFSGYALFCAYERAAFGELCAAAWIPLLLLFSLRDREPSATVWHRALDGSAAPLALALAGAWLSDAPGGVMASYLLAGIALATAALARSWFPVLRASIAFTLGMGLCAFYVLPAAFEQRWVDILQSIGVNGDAGVRIENNWLFPRHSDLHLSLHDAELRFVSVAAVFMIGVALTSGGVLWARRKSLISPVRQSSPNRQSGSWSGQADAATGPVSPWWWIPLTLIPAVVLFLLLPVSLPVWNLLPKLRYLQFPWRWLMVVEAPMAVLCAAAVWPSARSRKLQRGTVAAGCALVCLAATMFAAKNFFRTDHPEDRLPNIVAAASSSAGFVGTDEYAPRGADNSIVATGLPDGCLVDDFDRELGVALNPEANPNWRAQQGSCLATATATLREPEHLRIAVSPAHAGFVILRLRSYPAWRITVNGRLVADLPMRADGLVVVPVPSVFAKNEQVEVGADWITTPDVVLGRCLSGLALLMLVALGFNERKHARWRRS